MRVLGISVLLTCLTLVTSCGLTPPKPSESEYFLSKGGGFVINREAKTIKYGLTIASKGRVVVGNVIEARFENPSNGEYLKQTVVVEDGQTTFVFTSPPVTGLKAYTNYVTEFLLYESSSKNRVIGTHSQSLQSLIDQDSLGW